MKTIKVEIIRDEAISLLKNLESLNLIHIHPENNNSESASVISKEDAGSISKESVKNSIKK